MTVRELRMVVSSDVGELARVRAFVDRAATMLDTPVARPDLELVPALARAHLQIDAGLQFLLGDLGVEADVIRIRDAALRAAGYVVLRFTEEDLNERPAQVLAEVAAQQLATGVAR